MKFLQSLHLLSARHQVIVNGRSRNGSREALTALRKVAQTRKTSVPAPIKSNEGIAASGADPLVKEV